MGEEVCGVEETGVLDFVGRLLKEAIRAKRQRTKTTLRTTRCVAKRRNMVFAMA